MNRDPPSSARDSFGLGQCGRRRRLRSCLNRRKTKDSSPFWRDDYVEEGAGEGLARRVQYNREYPIVCSKLCSQKVSVTADVELLAGRACDRQDC